MASTTRGVAALIHAGYLTTAAVEVADDIAHVLFRGYHFHLHDRLEQLGAALLHAFTESGARGDFKRQHGRVNVVVSTVVKSGFEVHHREPGENTGVHLGLEAFFNARDVFLGNVTANDGVLEFEAGNRVHPG